MILLDVELGPGPDGFEICRALRDQANDVPIIMLTGLQAEADAVKGLEAGADDYMTKPFGLAELNSRIKAVLRRAEKHGSVRVAGGLRMDLGRREVTLEGERVHLTFSEFQVLAALLERPGAVCSRAELMTAIWGDSAYRDPRGIDVHVRHLREKLGEDRDRDRPWRRLSRLELLSDARAQGVDRIGLAQQVDGVLVEPAPGQAAVG